MAEVFPSAQRTGVQLRAPEGAVGERQARLLQRLVGRPAVSSLASQVFSSENMLEIDG